jgi:hypothetical protein
VTFQKEAKVPNACSQDLGLTLGNNDTRIKRIIVYEMIGLPKNSTGKKSSVLSFLSQLFS